ncbi:MAG: DUF4113 domain-containing protein [bacterium]
MEQIFPRKQIFSNMKSPSYTTSWKELVRVG